jgi:hypothetical protein
VIILQKLLSQKKMAVPEMRFRQTHDNHEDKNTQSFSLVNVASSTEVEIRETDIYILRQYTDGLDLTATERRFP